ncbi:MAG: hypothetical protein ACYTBJ_09965, partial [Planctomycetota bacterium]
MAAKTSTKRKKPEEAYELRGLVRDLKTMSGLPGYVVCAFDVDRRDENDRLGRAITRLNGEFVIHFTREDFVKTVNEETLEGGPDIVLVVSNRFGRV